MTPEQQAIEEACRALSAKRPDRSVPSPSSVMRCTRSNWYKALGVAPTGLVDAESYIAQESGRATEPVLCDIIERAGFGRLLLHSDEARELIPDQLERISMRGGQVDNVIELAGAAPAPVEWREPSPYAVVEFKRKGVFGFLNLLRKGVQEGEPDDYVQAQCYMHALDLPVTLYVASNWDRSALTNHTVGRSGNSSWRDQGRPFGVHVEWIARREETIEPIKRRAEMQLAKIEKEDDAARVPRDYNPDGRAGAKPDWQCEWCPWMTQCREDGVRA